MGAPASYCLESSRRAPMDAPGLRGRARWGTATRLARSNPPTRRCASASVASDSFNASGASDSFDASVASDSFDAFGAFGPFGPFGFADRLPDRTERNARRTGAPKAAPQVRNIRMNPGGRAWPGVAQPRGAT
jgi:hypothetical protein